MVALKMKLLSYKNNWEADEYYTDKTRVDSIEEVSIDGVIYKVSSERKSIAYNDHGHTYCGDSIHYFVKENSFGTMIDLNKIIKNKKVYFVK